MIKKETYRPPYSLTSAILHLVAEIGEAIGRYTALAEIRLTPRLRRENRVRTIQASLAIENNTLTLEQVTAVVAGKRVLGSPREIQEVRNAFAAYGKMKDWEPTSRNDLLAAHGVLMAGLVDGAGKLRPGNVGVFHGERLIHMAPPAKRVSGLVDDLLDWLMRTDAHPLVASCVFHYEFEFIHPFADGNGRMGRLWQTLILLKWKPLLAYLPVETVIRDRQDDYHRVLARADKAGDSTLFVEFMLTALFDALREAVDTDQRPRPCSDQVTDQVTDQVARTIQALAGGELGASELMQALGLSHRDTFRRNYLNPSLDAGWIERTQPDSPRSPTQRYRLTDKGKRQRRQ